MWLEFILVMLLLFRSCATPDIGDLDHVDGVALDPILLSPAQVILEHHQPSCGGADVPFPMDGRIALMCNFIESIYRECLGSRVPMFIGRRCRGQRCVLDFAGPDAVCLYTMYGQPVHPSKKSLAWTCGLETDDPNFNYRTPRPLPPLGEPLFEDPALRNCGRWLPQGISGVEWTECVGGIPVAKMELVFEIEMPSDVDYHCLLTPLCGKVDYIQNMLCYVDLNDVDGGTLHFGDLAENGTVLGAAGISNGIDGPLVLRLPKVLGIVLLAALFLF